MTTPLAEHSDVQSAIDLLVRVESKDGYGIPGELAVFEVDAAGRVTRVRMGENYTDRIESWEDR